MTLTSEEDPPEISAVETIPPRPRPTDRSVAARTNAEIVPEVTSDSQPAEVVTAVEEGLAAWGRFAVSGDLDVLEPWFDNEGPQYGLLAAEAARLAASPLGLPEYSVTMSAPQVGEVHHGEASVEGRVVFARTGEPSQSFWWSVLVRRSKVGWRIWTVEEPAIP